MMTKGKSQEEGVSIPKDSLFWVALEENLKAVGLPKPPAVGWGAVWTLYQYEMDRLNELENARDEESKKSNQMREEAGQKSNSEPTKLSSDTKDKVTRILDKICKSKL
ncbi:hypothetical protein Bhyg_08727 [Pseudolycoriella hygida]|uniref:Uncharacterized protein n=1 Tax=Pseudolycoriella hygida TaxID=35572 RepID=A0A9Q0N563_9DIPT|nr:hypothetical protein Bhyg_08727 [Pseudolycoriella hygida]